MRRRRPRHALAAAVVVGALLACWPIASRPERASVSTVPPSTASGVTAPQPVPSLPSVATTTPAGAPFGVDRSEMVLEDRTRPGPDRGSGAAAQYRRLRVVVRRPIGATGTLPLIVFAHGYDTDPETYERLLDAWAEDGYLVAAPDLPGSADDLPGTPIRDIADQSTDLSFVLTALLHGVAGSVDERRVVAAGHSDGGSAVAALALNSALLDDRFDTYVVLSGAMADQITEGTWQAGPSGHQMLVMVGDEDEYGNLPAAHDVWSTAALAGALLVVPGGDHQGMYSDESTFADRVRASIVQALDLMLDR